MRYIIKYSIHTIAFFAVFTLVSWILIREVNFIITGVFSGAWTLLRIGNDFVSKKREDEE